MGAANHASSAIREKHWRAIARDNAKDKTRAACHHSIGFRALIFQPGIFRHHNALAMHLRQSAQRLMRQAKRRRRARAIFPHRRSIILAGKRAIQ